MRAHNEHAMLNCQTNSLYITIFANCCEDPCIFLLIDRMNCLEAMLSEFVGLYHFVEKTNHFVEKTNHSAEQKNISLAARATSLEPSGESHWPVLVVLPALCGKQSVASNLWH